MSYRENELIRMLSWARNLQCDVMRVQFPLSWRHATCQLCPSKGVGNWFLTKSSYSIDPLKCPLIIWTYIIYGLDNMEEIYVNSQGFLYIDISACICKITFWIVQLMSITLKCSTYSGISNQNTPQIFQMSFCE